MRATTLVYLIDRGFNMKLLSLVLIVKRCMKNCYLSFHLFL